MIMMNLDTDSYTKLSDREDKKKKGLMLMTMRTSKMNLMVPETMTRTGRADRALTPWKSVRLQGLKQW